MASSLGIHSLTACLEGLALSPKSLPKSTSIPKRIQTEDTGKMFERAICLAYDIPYEGIYKYSMEMPEILKGRLMKLTTLFPMCRHTAQKQSRYDFTSIPKNTEDHPVYLSAKTTKKGIGKVAPQVIGQCKPEKFAELTKAEYTGIPDLKKYIQTNIPALLPVFMDYTFDCSNVYYNQQKNTIRYITLNTPIQWDTYEYLWSRSWDTWNNSSILKVKTASGITSLMEIQFHSKRRTNMAVRWFYENLLTHFAEHFNVVEL